MNNKKAFTLIELLTVVAIIAILTAVALPQYNKVVEKARFTKAQVMAKALYDSCERLVAGFGVEDYGSILNDTSLPESAKKLSRLDVASKNSAGVADQLPPGFTLNESTNSISGATFIYTLRQSGACYVTITKPAGDTYAGVSVGYSGTGFTCSGNATACNIYGLD